MKTKGLLIAVAVLAALSGLVWWSQRQAKEDLAKPADGESPKILVLNQAQIDEIHFNKPGAEPVVVAKLAGHWEIVKPQPFPADQDAVVGVLSTACALTADRLIEDKPASLAPFGLQRPPVEIALHVHGGKTSTVQFGNATPSGSNVYVKLAGDPRVFAMPSYGKTNIDKSLNDLRDKRLLTFNSDKLSQVELTSKGVTTELGKNAAGDWAILKPEPARADSLQVEDLVRRLKSAQMDFTTPPLDKVAAPLLATVKVTDPSGVQTLEVRQNAAKNAFARSSVVPGIWKAPADLADALAKPVSDLRNKKLFDFGFDEISEVTVQGTLYKKSADKWFSAGKEINFSSLMDLIDKLRNLTAIAFATKASGAVVFDASVVTLDKKHSEKVVVSRDASGTFARREGEAAVYLLDNGAADALVKVASAVKRK